MGESSTDRPEAFLPVRSSFRDRVVVVILVLAGIFDWLSGNPIHSILLFAAALALVWDAVARGRRSLPRAQNATLSGDRQGETNRALVPAALVVALAFAILVGGFGRYLWP